ncbi:hypothetical protein E9531_02325 [Lampropedia puyangensis]|uniref:Uncharacterized protein n=1 Tax=Lampropedia puyangensis TaxID=1330072 RepID=A0A4S8FEV8_9BURK|nr:hypothetical protein [Lampropedia puyangensis]THU05395.1 hypothetical protein E9531_02325 [Lampropedia puyangensis]
MTHAQDTEASNTPGRGVLESIHVAPDRTITLTGWAVSHRPDVFVTFAKVWLGDQLIYQGRLGYATARVDVAQSLNNPLWETSGFSLPLHVPDAVPAGMHSIRMQVMLGDKSHFDVQSLENSTFADIPPPPQQPSHRAKFLFWLAIAIPLLAWLIPPNTSPNSRLSTAHSNRVGQTKPSSDTLGKALFLASISISFVLLVAGGWTGSSITRLLNQTPVISHNASVWMGHAQDVRADEWQVVTPLAISQTQVPNRFPNINPLHGQPGQNMNVVGMTGAPISNAAAIAKPATWGFFFLDMRRALAWDWWLPFFACFSAVFALLQRWFNGPWKLHAALAATVAWSGYSVSWSGWPAYATFFPLAAALAADVALRATRWPTALAASACLGWAFAGFVLVLYPGWQIPLGYLMVFATLAAAWQFRAQLHFGRPQLIGILLATTVAAILLGAWWLDGKDAIEVLRHTVYPGQRSIDLGGYADPWHLSKGLTNSITLFNASQWSIASDAGNFIYVLPPLALATLVVWDRLRGPDAISLTLWAYIAFVSWYMFWGLPGWLAHATLWSMAPAFRLDVALGLAQTLLWGWLIWRWQILREQGILASSNTYRLNSLGVLGGVAFVYLTAQQFDSMPAPLQGWLGLGITGLIYMGCAALGFLLASGRLKAAILIYAAWTLATALPFNPITQAPSFITPVTELAKPLDNLCSAKSTRSDTNACKQPQIAVVAQREWSNALASAGVSVLNSTFYEPPLAFWARLDPDSLFISQYNRYQHLHITLSEKEANNPRFFSVGAPAMDRVELRLEPTLFDFRLLNVEFVLTNTAHAAALQRNASLQLVAQDNATWALFQVVP